MNREEELALLKLENQLCFPLYAASRMITRAYTPLLEQYGLTYPQYLVLMVLWEEDGVPVGHLSEQLLLNTNTITPLLQRMEQQGFLVRKVDPKDERKRKILLTAKGKALKEEATCIPLAMLKQLNYPPEKIELLKNELNELIKVLDTKSQASE